MKCAKPGCQREAHPCYGSHCEDCFVDNISSVYHRANGQSAIGGHDFRRSITALAGDRTTSRGGLGLL